MITGSCLCGAIRYEVTGEPVWAHNCHCRRCRKIRGTAFASNLFVPLADFRFAQGEDLLGSYKLPEAERFTHVFCRTCGSSLPFRNEARGVAVIPMGSLDDDPGREPGAHIFVASKANWFTITDSLPQYPEQIEEQKPTER
ncbi:MAG: GFA family protein [Proteobacteria bacterium]|nr:GFA family protein [Pseudomonadota bacterium]